MQVLRKEAAAGRWSWQQLPAPADGAAGAAAGSDGPLSPPWANNGRDGGACGPAHALSGCRCGVAEPSEEEYTGALAEAKQGIQAAVTAIHEVLDELRQALADEQAEAEEGA